MSPEARSVQTILRSIGQPVISSPRLRSVARRRCRAPLPELLRATRFRPSRRESQYRWEGAESPEEPVLSRSSGKCSSFCPCGQVVNSPPKNSGGKKMGKNQVIKQRAANEASPGTATIKQHRRLQQRRDHEVRCSVCLGNVIRVLEKKSQAR